jgi:serine/threonine-protein kinase
MHRDIAADSDQLERFRREARAVAQFSHPHIVGVIDAGEEDGRPYIVFEYVEGETLKDRIRRLGRLPVDEAIAYAIEIARALGAAHGRGIVHRDVKPQNVLIDEEGTAKVTDFGIARSLDPGEELTQTGTLLGTSDYIAPEQASGQPVDARSDQYSLGVLLYELLTGEVPYPADSFMAVAMRHLRDPVPSVRDRRPDVPDRVDEIVARAMAKRPEDRFPSTEAMMAAIEAALADTGEGAGRNEATGVLSRFERPSPGRSAARPGPRRRQRRRRFAPLLLALLVVGAGAIALAVILAGRDGGGSGAAGSIGGVKLTAIKDYDPRPLRTRPMATSPRSGPPRPTARSASPASG